MIITFLLNVLIMIFSVIFYIFPVVTIADLPLFGQNVSDALYSAIGFWNSFMITFPYAETGWDMFIYVVIPFEIGLLVLKFFLGSRAPAEVTTY